MQPSLGEHRIVSLLPSATEVLFWLGAGEHVVGVTYECLEPAEAADRPTVTNTIIPTGATPAEIDQIIRDAMETGGQLYTLDRTLLAELEPTIIVTQDLCQVCALPGASVAEAVEDLGLEGVTIFTYDPKTLDGVIDEMQRLSDVLGIDASEQLGALRERLEVARSNEALDRPCVLLLEWVDPAFGPGHWIPDMIEAAGGEALLANPGGRSSTLDWSAIATAEPDVLLVAPCGFGHEAATEQLATVVERPELAHVPAVQSGRAFAIDGDAYVVRPGPRLLDGVDEIARLIHAEP